MMLRGRAEGTDEEESTTKRKATQEEEIKRMIIKTMKLMNKRENPIIGRSSHD